jgi:prephenate dehydrogenase
MTSGAERVAVVGTGLIGTSIGLAAARVGCEVTGWDADPSVARRAAELVGFAAAATLEEAVRGADVIVVATPIPTIAGLVVRALAAAPGDAVVTDVGSVKSHVVADVASAADADRARRFIPGHPMGGSERSGPDHASASVVDGIVWAVTPPAGADPGSIERLEGWIERIGARVVRMAPARHDRLVAFVSHLPQVASTALMDVAATEEADEPEILLLAAGGFRDLTRLASSNPALWSDILLSNREAIVEAIEIYTRRLAALRMQILQGDGPGVESVFDRAKAARLRLATKPTVRAGVAVLQVPVPDRPGSLAALTAALGEGGVNIEDLQIVHSPEGGRGTVHLTVAAEAAASAATVLVANDFDPTRLA